MNTHSLFTKLYIAAVNVGSVYIVRLHLDIEDSTPIIIAATKLCTSDGKFNGDVVLEYLNTTENDSEEAAYIHCTVGKTMRMSNKESVDLAISCFGMDDVVVESCRLAIDDRVASRY